MNPSDYVLIKTIRSHSGLARFMAECSDICGEAPRDRSIPSPYAYNSVHPVFQWGYEMIFIVETSHKVFKVFAIKPESCHLITKLP